ncbi:MAG: YfhO family protein [Lachnospiraceae bacterium]|nr:YfhO family protein [Lachnospiraceae bacterium]
MLKAINRNRKILCPLMAFLIPVTVMVFVCIVSGFYPFGNTSILMADMRYQFVDYFGYMKQIFFSNDTVFYTFSKTLGGDMAGLASYYCNNPLLVFLLFVPNDILPCGILIMMIVMIGLIGLTFNIFLSEVYGSRYATLIFSTAYALMGYLMGYFNCVHYFFDIMMLPLVMLGIYRIIRDEKISILYIVSLAMSIFSCYYIGYMICIFSVVFFSYVFFTRNSESKTPIDLKSGLKPAILFIGSSILAAGLSAVSLLCAVISLREQSGRKHTPISFKGNFNIAEVFSGLYSNSFNGNVSDDGLPIIYVGAVALVFMILFYLNKNISKREKLFSAGIFLFLILGFYIDCFNVAWHGFSYPIGFPYRNSFLLSFFLLFLSYKSFKNTANIGIRQFLTPVIIYVIYSIYMRVILSEYVGIRQILITGLYILAVYVLIYIRSRNEMKVNVMPLFFILTLIDLTWNAYVSVNAYFPDKKNDESISIEAFKNFVDETKAITGHIYNEDGSFYRMEKLYRRSNNDAMLIGYNGLSHFSSCESEQAMRFLGSLGFRDNGNWAFYGEGSTTFSDCLLGVKYMLSQYDETPKPYSVIYNYNDKRVFQNPYALPLCFTMQHGIEESDPAKYDHFSYQNALARSFGYEGNDIYTKVEGVDVTLHNINKDGNTYTAVNEDGDSYIELSFTNTSRDFIYMYFTADELQDVRIVVNGLEKQPYFTSYGWSIRELGHYPEGEKVSVLLYPEQDKITLNGYEFYHENKEAIEEWYKAATRDNTELNKITSSHLTGKAEAGEDKLLVFSFPYNNAWNVYVDGVRAGNKSVMNGLLAVDISKGSHSIELKYMPKGFKAGLPVSILCLIILASLLLMKQRVVDSPDKC